jgi:G6PDH family F420-dependent oxidoreductase
VARIGYFLSCAEFGPKELVRQARLAEQAGFDRLWISDHYHPWNDEQGDSPFVWSLIGALSEATSLPITTAATCPTVRIHPAVIAQAAATAAVQCDGRFVLGVGSGEALNEHILGNRWPPVRVRQAMLCEAIQVIRTLHTGRQASHRGSHYTVEDARIYTLPERPVPIYVSGFGPASARLAGELVDRFCTTMPDAELVRTFRSAGGGDKPVQAGMKVRWAPTVDAGVETAHRLWPNELLPGELAQLLPRPKDFAEASTLVTPEAVAGQVACGPEPKRHIEAVRPYLEAGVDELYVQQIGPDQDEFFTAWANDVLPALR